MTEFVPFEDTHQTLVLSVQAAAFAKAQIRTIGNAIKKLSSELYTKDVHFIMELVQVRQECNTQFANSSLGF